LELRLWSFVDYLVITLNLQSDDKSLTGEGGVSYTIKDIARLAGVSTATVSRVANGAGNVSGKIRDRVMSTISTLQYCPNIHAAELGRRNGKTTSKRGSKQRTSGKKLAMPGSHQGAEAHAGSWKDERLRLLEDENSRLKLLVTTLTVDC
jgi:hypothetical protein